MTTPVMNILMAHPYAAAMTTLGVFFALTANFVKTVDTVKDWLRGGKRPTAADVKDAGIPCFGARKTFGQNFAFGAATGGFGAFAADAGLHSAAHAHDAAAGLTNHAADAVGANSHLADAHQALHHLDSIGDIIAAIFEAIFS